MECNQQARRLTGWLPSALNAAEHVRAQTPYLLAQGLGTLLNTNATRRVFSSYQNREGLPHRIGAFAQRLWPQEDSITLTVLKSNTTDPVTVTVPFRTNLVPQIKDGPSWFAEQCLAPADASLVKRFKPTLEREPATKSAAVESAVTPAVSPTPRRWLWRPVDLPSEK